MTIMIHRFAHFEHSTIFLTVSQFLRFQSFNLNKQQTNNCAFKSWRLKFPVKTHIEYDKNFYSLL